MADVDPDAVPSAAEAAADAASGEAVSPIDPRDLRDPDDPHLSDDPPLSSIDTSMHDEPSLAAAQVALPEFGRGAAASGGRHLGLLLDVGVEVAAVVGTRELKLEQVMGIQPGTIIDLDKHAGSPIELYVNGKPIALAEIVVVDGRLGARVVESLAARKG